MKYTWEPTDIKPGIFVCKHYSYNHYKKFTPCGNTAKWTYLIGYSFDKLYSYTLIHLDDGEIGRFRTVEEMCKSLNKQDLIPMPVEWLVELIKEYK